MKLSIITINYNNAKGLERTIQSVLSQSSRDIQYIVVDGNSTDGSKDVLARYSDRIDVSISEPDTGIYNAMNKGAAHATGEYLLFINSGDELYSSQTIEEALPRLGADVVCGCVLNYSDRDVYKKIPPKRVSLFTFTGGSLPHPSAFIRRSLFEKVGGYKECYRIISDWCFFVDALLVENCTYATTDQVITLFKRDGVSSTSGRVEEPEKERYLRNIYGRVLDDYLDLSEEAIENVGYWVHDQRGWVKQALSLPYKCIGRILNLRQRLSRRIGARKMPYTPELRKRWEE